MSLVSEFAASSSSSSSLSPENRVVRFRLRFFGGLTFDVRWTVGRRRDVDKLSMVELEGITDVGVVVAKSGATC